MIHILTLNCNGLSKLDNLVHGLANNISKLDMLATWHVKDNGSKDASVNFLSNIFEAKSILNNSKVYSIGHNRDNFSQGVNYLFERANPSDDDYILLLNNDVSFADDMSLSKMINLQKRLDADIVGARLLYTNTNLLQHAGVIFSDRYERMPLHYRFKESSDKDAEKNRYFQAVTGAVMLVKVSAFKQVNGLTSSFNWGFDDIDFCLKIGKLHSRNIVYCGETNIYYEESAALKKNLVNKLFLDQNVRLFKETWFGKYDIDHEKYLQNPKFNEI